MGAFTLENPVFTTYIIAAALTVLKVMGQGWMTVYRMLKSDSGLVNPEDIQAGLTNRNPRPEQLDVNDYVDRSRRMHRNDLENIPAFWAAAHARWVARYHGSALARFAASDREANEGAKSSREARW